MIQDDLMEILLDFPNKTLDEKLYLLAGKILLYYAENRQVFNYFIPTEYMYMYY